MVGWSSWYKIFEVIHGKEVYAMWGCSLKSYRNEVRKDIRSKFIELIIRSEVCKIIKLNFVKIIWGWSSRRWENEVCEVIKMKFNNYENDVS